MALSERKQRILTLMIEQYIRTGEPVGSKALAELLDNAVSSATIRNDMAELSALGYLEQPHTSAGRIPTAVAFRLYIDQLMAREPLAEENRRMIDDRLEHASHDPDRLIENAAQALAEVTGCAAVGTTPSEQGTTIRQLDVLRASPRAAALILMTASGLVRNRVCRFERAVSNDLLEQAAALLQQQFCGEPLIDVTLPRIQSLMGAFGEHALLLAPLLTGLLELAQETVEADVLLTGHLNLLRHPDYAPDRVRLLLQFLSQRELLSDMLTACSGGLQVVLGSEVHRPELDGSSIIVTRYRIGERSNGAIGIIGPQRMDYAAAIPRIEYFAQSLGRLLREWAD